MDNNLRVVVAAAGSGRRMGSKVKKQYLLLDHKPILSYCIEVLENSPLVEKIIIVAHPQEVEYCKKEIAEKYGYQKVDQVVAGGPERQDSVYEGLKVLGSDTVWAAVQDGARPFLTAELLKNLFEAAVIYGAAIPGIMAGDTLKKIDQEGMVVQTLARSTIAAVQTPQVFDYHKLMSAYERALQDNFHATDDAALYEKYAGPVKVINGDPANIKITHPQDLLWAEAVINARKNHRV
ncbi:MAG: 2-C-methyl-D-erythritol 4-phosphate cytidylyltransferase [Syntrophomonadaceae bacterium]|jgi:2-C-methyl-D-erythritol 4-phosphate cytidylyltransferase|nr:2-C-methyl-D-erythritol 4-phosphate cytidylyltransferase [Syntrophomonadaceae bacterium]